MDERETLVKRHAMTENSSVEIAAISRAREDLRIAPEPMNLRERIWLRHGWWIPLVSGGATGWLVSEYAFPLLGL